MSIENQTKIRVWKDSSFCPEPRLKIIAQEFHLMLLVFWRQLLVGSRLLGVCYGCRMYLSEVVVCYYTVVVGCRCRWLFLVHGCLVSVAHTAKNQYRKLETNIPWQGIVRPQSHFPHSCVSGRFIYSHDRSAYSAEGKMWTYPGNMSLTDTWMWKWGLRLRNSQKRKT